MDLYKNFAKNIGIVGATNIFVALERMILLPVITKLLGVGDYAVWTQVGVTISLIPQFSLLGLRDSMIRFLSGEKDEKEIREGTYAILSIIILTSLLVGFLLFFFSQPIAEFLQIPPIFVKYLAPIIFFECLILVLLNVLQTFQKIGKYSLFVVFRTLAEIVLVMIAVLLGYGLSGAVFSLLIVRIITFLILSVIILRKIGFQSPVFKHLKEYLAFGLPRIASSASVWVVTSSDRYLIGFYLGIIFVGYYSPAYTIGNAINFFLYPLLLMLPIVLSKSFDEQKTGEVKTYLEYSLKYFLLIAIPAAFGISVLSKQLLTIFSTQEIALNSYYITPFVALSILLYGVSTFFGQIIKLVKKTKITSNIWIVAAVLNIGLNIYFIPRWGILGAALTTLLAYIFAFALTWYYSFKELRFRIDWKSVIIILLSSTVMALAIFWFNPANLFQTILAILLGALLYGILIILFQVISKKEKEFLKSLLHL
jgi:O-antigen/teichoic acid export membrane protein